PTPYRSSSTKHCDRSAPPLVPSWVSSGDEKRARQRLKSLPIPDRTPPSFFAGTGVFLGVFEGRPEGVAFEGTPELRRVAGFEFRSPLARRISCSRTSRAASRFLGLISYAERKSD